MLLDTYVLFATAAVDECADVRVRPSDFAVFVHACVAELRVLDTSTRSIKNI